VSSPSYQRAQAAYQEEYPQANKKAEELLAEENAQRKKKGLRPVFSMADVSSIIWGSKWIAR